MRALADAGIPVGINIAPVIPGLNDRNIPNLLRRAAACGATQAGISPVRLPGSVAQVFLSRLRRELPQAAARVEARIRDLRGGKLNDPRFGHRMNAEGTYWESIERLFELTATQLGLLAGQKWTRREEKEEPRGVKQLPLFG
jgi:DNA repair photolyase